jgi:hypothetical protein
MLSGRAIGSIGLTWGILQLLASFAAFHPCDANALSRKLIPIAEK